MAESLEEEKKFSGVGEEREKEALEASPTEPTEISKSVLEGIDIAEVHEAASAHYNGLTDGQKEEATRFFNTMDKNEDGDISVDEFKTFLRDAGLQIFNPDGLFAKLDKDGNKSLSFDELVTFMYVLSHDEYKHLLKAKPSTDVRGQEASIALGTVRGANDKVRITPGTAQGANDKARIAPGTVRGANDEGRRWKRTDLSGSRDKFTDVYKLEEWENERWSMGDFIGLYHKFKGCEQA